MLLDADVGEKALFSVGDAVYTWADVVARAHASGLWETLEHDSRVGHGAIEELARRGEAPSEEAVHAAARAFRYERGLLSGDELEAWLDSRGISRASWEAHLSRSLAREQVPAAEPSADLRAGTAWVEGICSGKLESLAHELALLVAVAPGAASDRLDEEFESFCRSAATDSAIDREIESNQLHWLRVRYDAVSFDDQDLAGEVALCVRVDGDSLPHVAARIGAEVEQREDWLDDIDPELASRFFAADEGGLVGPLAFGTEFVLAQVTARTPALTHDDAVRQRAARALAERATARAVNERVRWLEPL